GNDDTVTHSLAQTTSKNTCGPGAPHAPGPQKDPLPSGSELLLAVGADLDLAGLRGRQQRQAHGQHTIGECGLDLVRVERVAQVETAGEGAGKPPTGDQLLVLTVLLGTLRGPPEHTPVHPDAPVIAVPPP